MNQPIAKALSPVTVAMISNNCLTLFESQQEFEGEQGAVTPAKSIWLNTKYAKELRDFLNEQYPIEDAPEIQEQNEKFRAALSCILFDGENELIGINDAMAIAADALNLNKIK